MAPVAFFRLFPMRAKTLGSEPVVAWAHLHGRKQVNRFAQLRLWRRHGATLGAECIAARMGLKPIDPGAARIGDAVVVDCIREIEFDGIIGICAGSFVVVGGFGEIRVGRFVIKRAWSLDCRP